MDFLLPAPKSREEGAGETHPQTVGAGSISDTLLAVLELREETETAGNWRMSSFPESGDSMAFSLGSEAGRPEMKRVRRPLGGTLSDSRRVRQERPAHLLPSWHRNRNQRDT
jgi:hypothetical protein